MWATVNIRVTQGAKGAFGSLVYIHGRISPKKENSLTSLPGIHVHYFEVQAVVDVLEMILP